ncbi:MAG: hypothetical protein OXB88_06515, partial [Bacteriovoracales bacterium]|nr:hypothetical protein [Bacteriovoracales bacterium]
MAGAQRKSATSEEIWEILREVAESQKKVAESQEKTDKQIDKNTKNLKRLEELFTGQWGKLMESLVRGDLIRVLRERGVEVVGLARETSRKHEGKD